MAESPESTVTILALLHVLRLMARELVAGEHRDNVERLIQCMKQRIGEAPLPRGIDVNDARSGFRAATRLINAIAPKLREQAAMARVLRV